jgi:multidrug efflux pump subunit AcrB
VALLLGLFAVLVTPREEEPQINVTMANVLIPFPGASSADVQNMVARPAEQVLARSPASSTPIRWPARHGRADGAVQGGRAAHRGAGAPVRRAQRQPGLAARNLGALTPIVKPKGIDDVPVLAVTLWSRDDTSAAELERVAARDGGRAQARARHPRGAATIGGPGRRPCRCGWTRPLRERGVDLLRLQQTLAAANLGMPSGSVVDHQGAASMLTVETGEFLRSADEVGDLVVGVHQGKPVYLREVARSRPARAGRALCLVHARRGAPLPPLPASAARRTRRRSTRP